jgi:hypothetical protein
MVKWPFVRRSALELAERRNAVLERRLFVLRDNMKEAKRRVGFNIRASVDNAAAYRVLDMALIRDLEQQ